MGFSPPFFRGTAQTIVHDPNGNITTDHRGRGYVYDAENVLRSATGLAAGAAAYRYHADGARAEKSYGGAVSTFYYDADQEIAEYNGAALLNDAASNITKLTYPDGWSVDFAYDALSRVTSANDNNGAPRVLASVAYDALSRRQTVSYANGTSASYAFSHRGDLTCHDWNFAGAAPANCNDAGAELGYDFTYNGIGQLLSESVSDAAYRWAPAANGTDAYGANGLNQYASITPSGQTAQTIVHDPNGNITTDHRGRGYVYDAENVLRSATGLASGAAAYRYHADGARAEKSYGGAVSTFYYDGDQEIAEYDPSSGSGATLLRRYVRLPGSVDEPALMIDYTLDAGCTNTSYANCERWAHQNRLGSVVAVTDANGAALEAYKYSPYGENGPEGDGGFPFRFTGQKLDPETGLYYYKARYYDPETGRFMQTDPIGYADQMNLYAYVENDPINLYDPEGEQAAQLACRTTAQICRASPHPYSRAAGCVGAAVSCSIAAMQKAPPMEGEGPFEQDETGKIKGEIGDLPTAGDLEEGELIPGERQLKESIAQREREQSEYPRGSPNGDNQDRENDKEYRRHQRRIDEEKKIRDDITRRIDELENS